MIWECFRHNWSELQAMGMAAEVPFAIDRLLNSTNEAECRAAFESINNNVVVQGALYEAAPPTAGCLVIALAQTSSVARIHILELLNDLCGGNVSPEEEATGYPLQKKCLREIHKGVAIYFHLLQHGTIAERRQCIDLLQMCAIHDSSLIEQVVWYLSKVKELQECSELYTLIDNSVTALCPSQQSAEGG